MQLRAASTLLVAIVSIACGASPAPNTPPPLPPEPPAEPGTGVTQCAGARPGPGYECVQNCGPPVASSDDPPPGYSWLSADDADKRRQFGCPICLPADAKIATPSGPIAISRLAVGTAVWSIDDSGERTIAIVTELGSTNAPPGHHISEVELADGRVLRASAGHPGPDGRAIGELAVGRSIDGSVIVAIRRRPYRGKTYDLRLDGGRKHYLSDGVLVQSSLAR